MIAVIAARSVSSPAMMSRLAAISPAPRNTSQLFQRQMRSTRWPSGIFSAHGMPAQKPSAARKEAESPR